MFSKKVNRFFASLICVVALLTVFAIPASAVAVTGVSGVEVTIDSNGSISESGGTVTATAKGSFTSAKTAEVTVTNTSGSTANISFDYSGTNVGGCSLGGVSSNKCSGTKTYLLTAGGTESFTITSRSWSTSTTVTMTLSNFRVEAVAAESNVTVTYGSLGSVKIDGTAVASGSVNAVSSATGASFVAVPGSGSKFVAWINPATNAVISTAATYQLIPTEAMAIRAVFANASSAPVFYADGTAKVFESLDAALSYAGSASNKTITLASDGTLPAGNYTIPAGITLLIPYNSSNTLCTTSPTTTDATYTAPTVYRTLIMADGAKLTVNGELSLSASQSATYSYNGQPHGPYGKIHMNYGSSIIVNNGAKLYCWGYITGAGSVVAENNSTIYECFQVRDFRGGDMTSKMQNNSQRVFPMSQYYVQNIEVPMTLKAGAKEYGFFSADVTVVGIQSSAIPFIGADGLFNITSGNIVKDYDESGDRLIIDVNGDITVKSYTFSIKLELLGGSVSFDSSKYVLGINNNMTINVNSGTTTVNQDLALQPGAIMDINQGAKVLLGSGAKLFVYDYDEWTSVYNEKRQCQAHFVYPDGHFLQLAYVACRNGAPVSRSISDASVIINGTLDVSAGYIYTTAGGANIYSAGTGASTLITGAAGSDKAYQVDEGRDANNNLYIDYFEIPITPAILQDADGTDVSTGAAGTYTYYAATGKWCTPSHRYGEGVVTTPTCTEAGYTTHTCIACGHSYTDTEVAAIGHTAGAAATCTTAQTCTVCGTVLNAALGHDMQQTSAAVAPTCTSAGKTAVSTCANGCGTTEGGEEIPALGHTEGEAVTENNTAESYDIVVRCTVCGTELSRQTIQKVVYSVKISWSQTSTAVYTPAQTTYTWSPEQLKYESDTIPGSWSQTSVMTVRVNNSDSTGEVTAAFGYTPAVESTMPSHSMTVGAGESADAILTVTPIGEPVKPASGNEIVLGTITITLSKGGTP